MKPRTRKRRGSVALRPSALERSQKIADELIARVRKQNPNLAKILAVGVETTTRAELELLSRLVSKDEAQWGLDILADVRAKYPEEVEA